MTRPSMVPNPPAHNPRPVAPAASGRSVARAFGTLVKRIATVIAALAGVVALSAGPAAAQTEVRVEKATNGADADTAPGPEVEPGIAVSWTWTVTASGATTLYDLVVTDTSGVTPSCDITGDGQPDGTNIHPGPLDPGQSFTCAASGAADHDPAAGAFAATGVVRATDFSAAASYEDQDPSHHTVATPAVATIAPNPGISIRASIWGDVADSVDGPLVGEGEPITWTYVVTNTGNVPLTGVEVSQDRPGSVNCGNGTAVVAGSLEPGETATCRVNAGAAAQVDGPQPTTGSVVAAAVDPISGAAIGALQASDDITYVPVQVPSRLAFTGPTDLVLPVGLTLTGLGAVLLLVANRADRRPRPAAVPTSGSNPSRSSTGSERDGFEPR